MAQADARNQHCDREDMVQQAGLLQLWQVHAPSAGPWGWHGCLFSPLQAGSWRGEKGTNGLPRGDVEGAIMLCFELHQILVPGKISYRENLCTLQLCWVV